MFYQISFSPQAKRWAIITYKHGIYELPPELLNDLIMKYQNLLELKSSAQPSYQNEQFFNTS